MYMEEHNPGDYVTAMLIKYCGLYKDTMLLVFTVMLYLPVTVVL